MHDPVDLKKMLQNAYYLLSLAIISADTAENERTSAKNLATSGSAQKVSDVLDEIAQKAQAPPSLRTPRSSGSRPQVVSLARASTLGPSERGSGGADASGVPKFGLTLS